MAENKEPVIGQSAELIDIPLKNREVEIIDSAHPHYRERGTVIGIQTITKQLEIALDECPHLVSGCFADQDQLKVLDDDSLKNDSNSEPPERNEDGQLWCVTCGKYGGHKTADHGQHGGARAGAGRQPGSMNLETKQRLAIKKAFEDRIHSRADFLLNAALNKALGETYLMKKITDKDSKGKVLRVYHEIVTNPQEIIEYLDGELEDNESLNSQGDGDTYYYMTTKPADILALKDLFDRAFGKPNQKVENTGEQKLIIETRRHKR